MSRRHSLRARRLREDLVQFLGGECALCGSTKRLEIDHPEGRNWSVTNFCGLTRVLRYWREYNEGVPLRCLCKKCNSRDGQARRHPTTQLQLELDNAPF